MDDPAAAYKFDLQGFIRLKGVLSSEEVAAANAAVDAHREEFELEPGISAPFEHIEGILGWPKGEREPFVGMLAHPRVVPYLNMICGPGFRMDHGPTILTMDKSSDATVGVGLHGSSGPDFDPSQFYIYRNGRMHNALVVVSFALVDQRPGDGGFGVILGSHKSNLRCPVDALYSHTAKDAAAFASSYYGFAENLTQEVVCDAGDVVIFTEALTHGTLPWTSDHQRRVCHFRYNAKNMAYSGGRHPYDYEHRTGNAWPDHWYEGLSDAQRAVLEPPYHGPVFTERPVLNDDGKLDEASQKLIAEKGWDGIGGNLAYEDTRPRRVARARKAARSGPKL